MENLKNFNTTWNSMNISKIVWPNINLVDIEISEEKFLEKMSKDVSSLGDRVIRNYKREIKIARRKQQNGTESRAYLMPTPGFGTIYKVDFK